jgi:hypothetical protein
LTKDPRRPQKRKDPVTQDIQFALKIALFLQKYSPLFWLPQRVRWIGWCLIFVLLYQFWPDAFWGIAKIGIALVALLFVAGMITEIIRAPKNFASRPKQRRDWHPSGEPNEAKWAEENDRRGDSLDPSDY